MGGGTFGFVVFAVLSVDLIEAFSIDRWQVGALVSAMALAGAFTSPHVGRFVDAIGARTSVVITLAGAAVGLLGLATATRFWMLCLGAAVGGVAQAFANPSTNKLIAQHVAHGRRGVVMGIKQSGVQFGVFLGGVALPAIASMSSWRWSVGAFVVVFGLSSVFGLRVLPPEVADGASSATKRKLPEFIWRLSLFGALSGLGSTAVTTFLPLYAVETAGFTVALAGLATAIGGATGIVGRIWWGHMTETTWSARHALIAISVGSAFVPMALLLAAQWSWLVWVAALLGGVTYSSWNAVGMLAIIQRLGQEHAGQGSGVVLLGFLSGLGVGAPLFGLSVDRLGSYRPGWVAVATTFGLGLLLMMRPEQLPGDTAV